MPNPLSLDHPSWNMQIFDEENYAIVREAMCHPDLYAMLEAEERAAEALQILQAEVGEVFSASTAMISNPMAHSAKAHWTLKVFVKEWTDRLVLTADKTTLRGVVLIDDKPEITGVMRPLWEHIVYHRNYNHDTTGVRIHDCSDASLEIIANTVERRLHELAG